MAYRRATVTQAEITRLMEAARDAGSTVRRVVKAPDGTVILHLEGDDTITQPPAADPWAEAIARVKD